MTAINRCSHRRTSWTSASKSASSSAMEFTNSDSESQVPNADRSSHRLEILHSRSKRSLRYLFHLNLFKPMHKKEAQEESSSSHFNINGRSIKKRIDQLMGRRVAGDGSNRIKQRSPIFYS